jgi:hypothetical protein
VASYNPLEKSAALRAGRYFIKGGFIYEVSTYEELEDGLNCPPGDLFNFQSRKEIRAAS